MEADFRQTTTDKTERYQLFLPQFELFIGGEKEEVSVLANAAAALREAFGFFWVGFYLVKGEQLILGPFQGSAACYRIRKGKGVCGTAWAEARTLVVPDVDLFPGHIACSSLSRSEIVVPLLANGEVKGVLDIDSDQLNHFDETDRCYLEKVAALIVQTLYTA
ncbi:MAG: GAF domain-containing protein [Bacteroidales bacterium]|nr:GAF domain-containing protein [Bacteroidales bacterium]